MNIIDIMGAPEEKPLERLICDSGFCGIFQTVGCIGDSLASGEIESLSEENIVGWHANYEYSWARYMTNMTGAKLHNFSRGGMTAEEFFETYAEKVGAFDMKNRCQCYILALGVNDINRGMELGNVDEVVVSQHKKASDKTFVGYYAEIIRRLKSIQPEAKFFLMTMPCSNDDDAKEKIKDKHADILRELAKKFTNTYVLDFRKYAPVYDVEFKGKFFMGGHMNPMGYILTGKMVVSYIDYIIRHNVEDFIQVGFIGTPYKNISVKANHEGLGE